MLRCGRGRLSSYGDLMLCSWAEQSGQGGGADGEVTELPGGVAAIADSSMTQRTGRVITAA